MTVAECVRASLSLSLSLRVLYTYINIYMQSSCATILRELMTFLASCTDADWIKKNVDKALSTWPTSSSGAHKKGR